MNRARAVRTQVVNARRDTGPSREQRAIVLDRALGCCEICGALVIQPSGGVWEPQWMPVQPYSVHHRSARGMGGSTVAWINSPANLLLLCGSGTTGCHGHVESHRAEAYENGWLISGRRDPATVPVLLAGGDRYLLTADGGRVLVPTAEGADLE